MGSKLTYPLAQLHQTEQFVVLKKEKNSVVDGSRKRGLKGSLTCTQFWKAMLRAPGG